MIETDAPVFPDSETFARLLVPVDFGPGSRRALRTALTIRKALGSEVHLFNLTDYTENDNFLAGVGGRTLAPDNLIEDGKGRLYRFVNNLVPGQSGEVIVHVRMGVDVVQGIEKIARNTKATLVLLSGHPKQSVFRTDIEKIARDIDAAVMILWVPEESKSS